MVVAPFASLGSVTASDWKIFFALGVFQMGLGLALLTVGARLLPPAEVALLSLLEVVLGPLWVWLAYAERPGTATFSRSRRSVSAITCAIFFAVPEGASFLNRWCASPISTS